MVYSHIFSLNQKVAIVTGAARGNGKAMAKGFLEAGATVVIADINETQLGKTHKELQEDGEVFPFPLDIADESAREKLVTETLRKFKKIDILLNNAGITFPSEALKYPEEMWNRIYQVNLKSSFHLCRLAGKVMLENRSGSIINITSLSTDLGFPNNSAYSTFKGGLKALSKSLAAEWGPLNVRVNNLCPGYIVTDMTKKAYDDPKVQAARAEKTLLKRWGRPDDLVGAAIFLASPASSYITGQDIIIDGGWTSNGL